MEMGKKVVAILFALGIIVSGILVIQAQIRLGKSVEVSNIKPTIHTYVFQSLNNGATQLRNSIPELNKLPDLVDTMFEGLANKRPQVQIGIKTLEETMVSLKTIRSDVEKNTLILPDIKTPLLNAFTTLAATLPALLTVLQRLDGAFGDTIAEQATSVGQMRAKVTEAVDKINGRDVVFGRTLPERMDNLAGFLHGLSI
jgi:hypothetical protein